MNNTDFDTYENTASFRLNLQIIADEFADTAVSASIHTAKDHPHLTGIRLFQKNKPLSGNHIYLLEGSQVTEDFLQYSDSSFLILGDFRSDFLPESCSCLQLLGSMPITEILSLVQNAFEKYMNWDHRLQLALSSDDPINQMLTASLDIFHNPIFAHDTNFYILSCPRHVSGMSVWERDSRTGRPMCPLSLIHEFQVNAEYQHTLTTFKPSIYSEEVRGYQILYMNLWVNHNYEGRLCVDELQSQILPGQFYALEYLGNFIQLCIRRNNLFRMDMGYDIRKNFRDFLNGSIEDPQQILDTLAFLNWNRHDRYLLLKMETQQQIQQMHSSVATLGHIETQIPSGVALTYQQSILVIANLSFNHSDPSEVISSLAIIMREGLFKTGVSSSFRDFLLLPQCYHQASEALRLGKESKSTSWCYRFDDFLLEYILSQSCRSISAQLLVSSHLDALRNYDREHNTELYRTLQVYLTLERNALQTAKTLFIHRSTLFYRLERIEKIAHCSLDDPQERLLYQLCFLLMQEKGNPDT